MKIIKWIAAVAGASGVALGAFGAHALRNTLAANNTAEIWRTATMYHLVHAVAVLGVALLLGRSEPGVQTRGWTRCAYAWAAGIVLFSGSLYGLALDGPRWLGPVTPIGGGCFLLGWFLVAFTKTRPAN